MSIDRERERKKETKTWHKKHDTKSITQKASHKRHETKSMT